MVRVCSVKSPALISSYILLLFLASQLKLNITSALSEVPSPRKFCRGRIEATHNFSLLTKFSEMARHLGEEAILLGKIA